MDEASGSPRGVVDHDRGLTRRATRASPFDRKLPPVDRRLAFKNLRTGLIAGAIAIIVFALSWVVGLVY